LKGLVQIEKQTLNFEDQRSQKTGDRIQKAICSTIMLDPLFQEDDSRRQLGCWDVRKLRSINM